MDHLSATETSAPCPALDLLSRVVVVPASADCACPINSTGIFGQVRFWGFVLAEGYLNALLSLAFLSCAVAFAVYVAMFLAKATIKEQDYLLKRQSSNLGDLDIETFDFIQSREFPSLAQPQPEVPARSNKKKHAVKKKSKKTSSSARPSSEPYEISFFGNPLVKLPEDEFPSHDSSYSSLQDEINTSLEASGSETNSGPISKSQLSSILEEEAKPPRDAKEKTQALGHSFIFENSRGLLQLSPTLLAILDHADSLDPRDFFELDNSLKDISWDRILAVFAGRGNADIRFPVEDLAKTELKQMTTIVRQIRFLVCIEYLGDQQDLNETIERHVLYFASNIGSVAALIPNMHPDIKRELVFLISDLVTFAPTGSISHVDFVYCLNSILNCLSSGKTLYEVVSTSLIVCTASLSSQAIVESYIPWLKVVLQKDSEWKKKKVVLQTLKFYLCFNYKTLESSPDHSECISALVSVLTKCPTNNRNVLPEVIDIYLILLRFSSKSSKQIRPSILRLYGDLVPLLDPRIQCLPRPD